MPACFSLIQCKPHQSLCLIGHKQRDVQYVIVQPQVIQGETDAEFDFIREQFLGFTGSGPAFINVKISSIFKVTSAGLFEEPGPVYLPGLPSEYKNNDCQTGNPAI